MSSTRWMPALSLAVTVTGSEPLAGAAGEQAGGLDRDASARVGSLIVMSEPWRRLSDRAAGGDRARRAAAVAADAQVQRVRVALVARSARGSCARLTVLLATATLFSG